IDLPGPDVRALFEEARTLGERLMRPRAVVRWAAVSRRDGDRLALRDGVTFTIPGVARSWGEVTEVSGAIVTIGSALPARLAPLLGERGSPLAAMVLHVSTRAARL